MAKLPVLSGKELIKALERWIYNCEAKGESRKFA